MVTDIHSLCISHRMQSLNPYCNGRWSLTTDWNNWPKRILTVLILIVMEDGHWQLTDIKIRVNTPSLNPYCNGRWSLTRQNPFGGNTQVCLNPYCNGRWSLTDGNLTFCHFGYSSLNPYCNGRWSLTTINRSLLWSNACLNPYCNGRWSLTSRAKVVGKRLTLS